MKPLVIDLCCGRGGWTKGFLAEGFRAIGFDITDHGYPAELVIADIREPRDWKAYGATVIVASPPCDEFSRWDQPWTRKRNPPEPDTSIVQACWRIAESCGVPIVLENVRGAQPWLGRARAHFGKQYLWGDVPALLPHIGRGVQNFGRQKQSLSSTRKAERAEIPFDLALYIARCFRPAGTEQVA